METKLLKIANTNNKLSCKGFIEIHFAPPHDTVRENDFNTIYSIPVGDKNILVKLVGFIRVPFYWIGCVYTLPATGLNSDEFKFEWLSKYPNTKSDTEMAVYCYQEYTA